MLYKEIEKKRRQAQREKRYWRKEYKNQESKYAPSWCLKQIERIDQEEKLRKAIEKI